MLSSLQAETPLLTPDILVCSVGTEILLRGVADADWEAHLDEGWDRDRAAAVASRFPELVLQQVSEQRPHKVSYKLYAADNAQASGLVYNLRSQLSASGLDANVVFSGGEDLDILPARASKGKALSFLLKQIRESTEGAESERGVLVCGDSGNDIELFEVPGVHGCMVANAHAELKEWCEVNGHERVHAATKDGPGGIVECLKHFDFIPEEKFVPLGEFTGRRRAVVDLHEWFESYFTSDALPAALFGAEEESPEESGLGNLEAALGENFELVGPGGIVTSRRDLLKWFKEKGRGSRVAAIAGRAAALSTDPLAPETSQGLLSAAMASAETPSTPTGMEPLSPADSGRFRIWIDCFSERELAPGLWLVRYKELQQRFPAGIAGRTTRWSSAVLREVGERYVWEYVHETWAAGGHEASSHFK